MNNISHTLIEMIFNNKELDSFEDLKRCYDLNKRLQEENLVEFKDVIDIIVKNKISLDWLKGFKDKGLMELKDDIEEIVKLGLKFDKLVKYKDRYDNNVDVIINCLYDEYNTSEENRKLVDELDYEGKKHVIDNLIKVKWYIVKSKLRGNIYNGDLSFDEKDIIGDLMFMRVLNIDVVNGDFKCNYNRNLMSLKGGLKVVNDCFYCSYCDLRSLEGSPEFVGGNFNCSGNKNLMSLKGGPNVVNGWYNCSGCDLRRLEGCPEVVGGFECSGNKNLVDLKGGPKVIKKGRYDCRDCKLDKLDGLAEEISGDLDCLEGNKFDWDDVEKYIEDNNIKLMGKILLW